MVIHAMIVIIITREYKENYYNNDYNPKPAVVIITTIHWISTSVHIFNPLLLYNIEN